MPLPWQKPWADCCAPLRLSSRPDFFKVRKVSTYFPGKLNHPYNSSTNRQEVPQNLHVPSPLAQAA